MYAYMCMVYACACKCLKELPGAGATGGFEYMDAGIKPCLQSALLKHRAIFLVPPELF